MTAHPPPALSIDQLQGALEAQGYIASDSIALTLYLALQLEKPILVEGPPGVGKTELAKAASALLARPLIRLQCYEGLDESKALYEWKYGKQLLYTQILKDKIGHLVEDADVVAFRKDESLVLPADLDYAVIGGLSNEVRDKLARARPATLGAAARISGVTPAALTALLGHVRRSGERQKRRA